MSVLIVADHDGGRLSPSTASTVAAARQLGGAIQILVTGHECRGVAEQAAAFVGVSTVKVADAPCYATQFPETIAALVLVNLVGVSHVLTSTTSLGKQIAPRVAARLNVSQISDVTEIKASDVFVRPIYSGSVIETVRSTDPIKVLTIRSSAFEAAIRGGTARIEAATDSISDNPKRLLRTEKLDSDQLDLATASIVVSGGRGLGTKSQFHELLAPLADTLGAALGASRAAVDAGFVSNALQVGETGKVVSPRLYFAVGISGAIQHVAGIMDSQVIVAINEDPDAPIFKVADYGLVGNLFEVIPQLVEHLQALSVATPSSDASLVS
jgi:electron transfer flavoprotein alpha subunit